MSEHGRNAAHSSSKIDSDERNMEFDGNHEWENEDAYLGISSAINEQKIS
jgi:hypothetical protein